MAQDNNQNLVGGIHNPNDLSREQKIMLTVWGEELYRYGLYSCLEMYNKQGVAGKMILFYEFKNQINTKISELYRSCAQEHFMNEDLVRDYLGFRVDQIMLHQEIDRVDVSYTHMFERKVLCDLGFELIRDDDELTTEEYNSDVGECETLDEI